MGSWLPSAPAATARAMNPSGSSVNTSILTEGRPRLSGVAEPLFSGSPRKTGAPSISNPTTEPRFHSSVAPSTLLYHASAAGASSTAGFTEINTFRLGFRAIHYLLQTSPAVSITSDTHQAPDPVKAVRLGWPDRAAHCGPSQSSHVCRGDGRHLSVKC